MSLELLRKSINDARAVVSSVVRLLSLAMSISARGVQLQRIKLRNKRVSQVQISIFLLIAESNSI
jgi:hypothetical protein